MHTNTTPGLASHLAGLNQVERPCHVHPASDDICPVKRAKHEKMSTDTQGWPVAHDYNNLGKAVLSMVQMRYKTYICANWPYLSADQQIEWAKDAWARSCHDKGVDGNLTDNIVKLVCIPTTMSYLLLTLCQLTACASHI
jgi:hypothetical protein